MNTKLANLLFEENNINNITKIFEKSNFLIKENSDSGAGNSPESADKSFDEKGRESLGNFLELERTPDNITVKQITDYADSFMKLSKDILTNIAIEIDKKNNINQLSLAFERDDIVNTDLVFIYNDDGSRQIPFEKLPAFVSTNICSIAYSRLSKEGKTTMSNQIKEHIRDKYKPILEAQEDLQQSNQSQKSVEDTNTNSADGENSPSNIASNSQKTSIFDQAFLKMKNLGDDKYLIETTEDFNLIVNFNTPIEVSDKNNKTIQLKNISFKPTQRFITDKICDLESEVVDREQVMQQKNINLSELKDKLPEKLRKDLEKLREAAQKQFPPENEDEKIAGNSEERSKNNKEKSEESTGSSLPPPSGYDEYKALKDLVDKRKPSETFKDFLKINDLPDDHVDLITQYADSFLIEDGQVCLELVETFYPDDFDSLDESYKKVAIKFSEVIDFDKAFIVNRGTNTFSYDENKINLYAAALVCIYASVVFENNDKKDKSSELIRHVENKYKTELEETQESPEVESDEINADESEASEESSGSTSPQTQDYNDQYDEIKRLLSEEPSTTFKKFLDLSVLPDKITVKEMTGFADKFLKIGNKEQIRKLFGLLKSNKLFSETRIRFESLLLTPFNLRDVFGEDKKNNLYFIEDERLPYYLACLFCCLCESILYDIFYQSNNDDDFTKYKEKREKLYNHANSKYKETLIKRRDYTEAVLSEPIIYVTAAEREGEEEESSELELGGESGINIDDDVMAEFMPFLESLDDTQVTVNLSELEDIKKKIEEKYKDKLDDDKIKNIIEKIDEVIELEKERKSKVKNVTELTGPEVRNRKNAIRSTFSVLENIVREKVDSKAKSEREKVLKDAESKALKNEDELLVTGMTVGATLALGFGLVALPVLGGGAGVLALAAGIAGMSPAGLAGAALSKKFGSKVQIPTIEELEGKGLADKLYTNETDKYTKILEKCIDVLIRKALRESKFIYKRGLQFLLEDSKEELDAAELRKSKIKDSESLQISKKDIENAFVGEGFDFFRKNKKHISKEEYEEFLSDFACILSYYHHVNVVDVITKKKTPEKLTLRSRKNEITTAANQLLNFIDSDGGQKVIEKIVKELDVSEEETKKLEENLKQVKDAVNETESSKDSASGDDDDKDDKPSENESEVGEDQDEDKNAETDDSGSSEDEQVDSDSPDVGGEEKLSDDEFKDDENEDVKLFSNRQAIVNELYKITQNIKKSNDREIGKIFKADSEEKAIVIYRQKSQDNNDLARAIKIAIIDPQISQKQPNNRSISAVEKGYAVGFYKDQDSSQESKKYIKNLLNTLCSFTDSKLMKAPQQTAYFKDIFKTKGINLSEAEVGNLNFDNNVRIISLKNEIDFSSKNESFVRSDLDLISERVVNSRFYKDKLSNLLFEEKEYNHSRVSFKSSRVNKTKSNAVRDLEKEMRRIWKI